MITEEIVKELRIYQMGAMSKAADRLEELERDLVRMRRVTTRPEPSRLEIAAMLLAALAGRESESWEAKLEAIWAIEQADALIAAATKEAK